MSLSVIRPDNDGIYTQWTLTDGATIQPYAALAPDGTFTAALVTFPGSGQPRINRQTTIASGTRTVSCWIRAKTGTVTIRIGNNSDYGQNQTIGTEWTRIVEEVPSSSNFAGIYCSSLVDSAEFYAWGFQQEAGTFPTSYIPTPAIFVSRSTSATYYDANGIIQTAGPDVARDDAYFPDADGVMRPAGLLLEAASTNSYTYSNDLTQSVYSKNNVTLSANAAVAPDGTTTATKVIPTTSSVVHSISRLGTLGMSSMRSVYVKAAGYTSCTVYDINTGARATIDLITGAITNASYFNFDIYFQARGRARNVGNGWWRIEVGYDSYSATNNPFHIYPNNDSTFAGDGTSGILVWGYQQEADVYPNPTSYIPTDATPGGVVRAADSSSSSTVIRKPDVASITGTNFSSWYEQSEGTLLTTADYNGNNPSNYNMIAEGYSGLSARDFSCGIGASNPNFTTRYSFTNLDLIPVGGPIPTKTAFKLVGSYSADGSAAVFNGGLVKTTGATTSVLTPADAMSIGYRVSSNIVFLNGHISRLTYYPVRLPDATLQALTL